MNFNHAPAYGFGRARKCEIEKTDRLYTPGPGQYAPGISGRKYPTWKIGTEMRGKGLKVPGPGNYNMRQAPGNGPKYTMRMRPYSAKSDVTPGPGNYNVRTEKNLVVPSYKFGHERKDGLDLAQAKYVPGPGNYEYNADAINVKHPKFSFGKEVRGNDRRPMTPGPGTYAHKQYVGKEGPHITMSAKYGFDPVQGDARYVPGPGMYNNSQSYLANHYKAPSYKIGTEIRGRGLKNDNLRPDLNPVDKSVPGPGNYNMRQAPGNGPKYTMRGKYNLESKNGNPGPGQYNNNNMYNKTHNPAWKIGTGIRDDDLKRVVREGVPGPGNYDFIGKNYNIGPKYKFGTERRGYVKKSDTPGPGQYHIPCAIVDVNDYTREQGKFDPHFRYI